MNGIRVRSLSSSPAIGVIFIKGMVERWARKLAEVSLASKLSPPACDYRTLVLFLILPAMGHGGGMLCVAADFEDNMRTEARSLPGPATAPKIDLRIEGNCSGPTYGAFDGSAARSNPHH